MNDYERANETVAQTLVQVRRSARLAAARGEERATTVAVRSAPAPPRACSTVTLLAFPAEVPTWPDLFRALHLHPAATRHELVVPSTVSAEARDQGKPVERCIPTERLGADLASIQFVCVHGECFRLSARAAWDKETSEWCVATQIARNRQCRATYGHPRRSSACRVTVEEIERRLGIKCVDHTTEPDSDRAAADEPPSRADDPLPQADHAPFELPLIDDVPFELPPVEDEDDFDVEDDDDFAFFPAAHDEEPAVAPAAQRAEGLGLGALAAAAVMALAGVVVDMGVL